MPYPINATHKLLLEDNVSYLLLEDNTSKLVLDETVALDSPLNAATVSTVTPGLTFVGENVNDVGHISLSDAFTSGTIDASKWTTGGSPTIVAGQLNLHTTAGTTNYDSLNSVSTYNLTGRSISAELVNAGNQSLASLQAIPVALGLDASNSLVFYIGTNLLIAQKQVAGVFSTVLGTTTYNPSIHKFFRIRESNGTIYWDFSTDNISWTNYTTLANPFAVTALTAIVEAGTFSSEATSSTVIVDNFNVTNLTYEVEVDTVNTFNSVGGNPLLDKTSNINTGFYDSTAGDTTDFKLLLETANGGGSLLLEDNTSYLILNQSFPSGDYVSYQVPSATLSNATTYYWRVRCDPSGGSYGEWSNIQSFATPANASITQVAATITFSGGTQVIGGPVSASIAQVGATLTFTGGTQTIATSNFVALSQVAATITFAGGTQAIATVNKVAIPQVAATITFAGGTQSVATVRDVAIAQVAATITFGGGTQAVTTVNKVAISQSAATITFGGGTQVVVSVQKVALAQLAGTITFAGGVQAIATVNNVSLSQVAATITFAGGTQVPLSAFSIALSQVAATLTFAGGVQGTKSINIVAWVSPSITVSSGGKSSTVNSGSKIDIVQSGGKLSTVTTGTKTDEITSSNKNTTVTSGGSKVVL